MEATQTPPPGAVVARNIKIAIIDKKITQHALAVQAGFSPNTFTRRLERPEKFEVEELGEVAAALGMTFLDLFKGAE
jgi:lambda repressor-like predicted transcriptional regulator